MNKINEFMKLPYNYIIQEINDESGKYFYAHILEFDGCQSTGNTFEEAYEEAEQEGVSLNQYALYKLSN